jgi:hypothetical protein
MVAYTESGMLEHGSTKTNHGPTSKYERGSQHMKVTPLVLPSLDEGIYGAKAGNPDF